MAQGWRQSWQDLVASLRRQPPKSPPEKRIVDKALVDAPDAGSTDGVGNSPAPVEPEMASAGDGAAEPQPEADVPAFPGAAAIAAVPSIGGAAAIAALAAVAWWTWLSPFSGGRAGEPPAPDVVATFDGGQITLANIEAHIKLLAPEAANLLVRSPDAMLSMVEDMISDQVILQWAAERKPEGDESFRHAVKHIDEKLSLDALSDQIHEEFVPVPESEIRAYYDTNKRQFEGQTFEEARDGIRQILVSEREPEFVESYLARLRASASITRNYDLLDVPAPTEAELRRYHEQNLDSFALPRRAVVDEIVFPITGAADVARREADDALLRIRGGASFAEAAAQAEGARLTTGREVAEGAMPGDWDKNVFALVPGELGGVFQAGDVFYIVRLGDLKPARNQDLSEVRAIVTEAVAREKEQEWFAANGAKTLFTIKSERYTVQQFYDEYSELPVTVRLGYSGTDGMRKLADALIDRILLVADTYDQLLDVKTRPLADESRLRLLAQMMEQEEVDDRIAVTDAQIQDFYDQNRDRLAYPPKTRIRYIRIGLGSTEDEARRARERANEAYGKLNPGLFGDGTDFATVARDYSEDPESAAQGGEFPGWIGEGANPLAELFEHPLHEAVLALEPGEIGRPLQIGDSLYIVEVLERTEAEPLSIEEAKPYIEEVLRKEEHTKLAAELQDRMLEEAEVEVYPSVLETYFATQSATTASEGS